MNLSFLVFLSITSHRKTSLQASFIKKVEDLQRFSHLTTGKNIIRKEPIDENTIQLNFEDGNDDKYKIE